MPCAPPDDITRPTTIKTRPFTYHHLHLPTTSHDLIHRKPRRSGPGGALSSLLRLPTLVFQPHTRTLLLLFHFPPPTQSLTSIDRLLIPPTLKHPKSTRDDRLPPT